MTLAGLLCLPACRSGSPAPPASGPEPPAIRVHPATADVDAFEPRLAGPGLSEGDRVLIYDERWAAVQRAVDHAGVTHDDAFYATRAYWHTGYLRGRAIAFEHTGDLDEKTFVDGRGAVRITGDVNAPLELTGEATVFIYGNLNAALTLRGNCEVIVAGAVGEAGAVACDGTLHVFVGGPMRGVIGGTRGSVVVIDDDMTGLIQCGEPATRVTITGDLAGRITPPAQAESVLTLRVDGYAPGSVVLDVMASGFTRINATLGRSDSPPGLYPDAAALDRPPTSRWVVLRQADDAAD